MNQVIIPENTIFIQYRRHAEDEKRVIHICTSNHADTSYEVRNAHGFAWDGQLLRTYDSRKQKHNPRWVLDYICHHTTNNADGR